MTKPTRDTVAGRAYLDLRAKAKKDSRSTNELLQLYALEGFLARLAECRHAKNLILKGGVLLAAYDLRRPTRDIDLLAQNVGNDVASVVDIMSEILGISNDDGCMYGAATGESIREDGEYQGVRVRVPCTLAGAQIPFHVDVSVGDPVWPTPKAVNVERLLGGTIQVRGYSLSMVVAEKIVTALQRRVANTRWRDFADVYLLSLRHEMLADELAKSLALVSKHRGEALAPLATTLVSYSVSAQQKWSLWVRKQRLDDRLPSSFADVLTAIQTFVDPVFEGTVAGGRWSPIKTRWL